MRNVLVLAILFVGSIASIQAQEVPAPPKELEAFAPLLGRWESTGSVTPEPEAPEIPWKAVTLVKKVLNGHALLEHTRIELGEQMGALVFITYYTYDTNLERHVSYTVGNTGELEVGEIQWIDANTMLTMSTKNEMGTPVLQRWTTRINGNKQEMLGDRAVAGGPMFAHVRGNAVRKDGPDPVIDNVGAMMGMPAPEEMTALARMAGRYNLKGSYRMDPKAEAVNFEGIEVGKVLFGGLVVVNHSSGDGYEGVALTTWNAHDRCYSSAHLGNWGMAHTSKSWLADNKLVSVTTMTHMGQPMTNRSVLTLDDKGRPTRCEGHTLLGTHAPYVCMSGTYTPATVAGN